MWSWFSENSWPHGKSQFYDNRKQQWLPYFLIFRGQASVLLVSVSGDHLSQDADCQLPQTGAPGCPWEPSQQSHCLSFLPFLYHLKCKAHSCIYSRCQMNTWWASLHALASVSQITPSMVRLLPKTLDEHPLCAEGHPECHGHGAGTWLFPRRHRSQWYSISPLHLLSFGQSSETFCIFILASSMATLWCSYYHSQSTDEKAEVQQD